MSGRLYEFILDYLVENIKYFNTLILKEKKKAAAEKPVMKEMATTAQGKLLWFGKILGGGVCVRVGKPKPYLSKNIHTHLL